MHELRLSGPAPGAALHVPPVRPPGREPVPPDPGRPAARPRRAARDARHAARRRPSPWHPRRARRATCGLRRPTIAAEPAGRLSPTGGPAARSIRPAIAGAGRLWSATSAGADRAVRPAATAPTAASRLWPATPGAARPLWPDAASTSARRLWPAAPVRPPAILRSATAAATRALRPAGAAGSIGPRGTSRPAGRDSRSRTGARLAAGDAAPSAGRLSGSSRRTHRLCERLWAAPRRIRATRRPLRARPGNDTAAAAWAGGRAVWHVWAADAPAPHAANAGRIPRSATGEPAARCVSTASRRAAAARRVPGPASARTVHGSLSCPARPARAAPDVSDIAGHVSATAGHARRLPSALAHARARWVRAIGRPGHSAAGRLSDARRDAGARRSFTLCAAAR